MQLRWTALVIFYVISLHTVADDMHSDDYHYHTAVNIINYKHITLKFTSNTKVPSPASDEAGSTR